ncbi:collagen alpha-1(I) chain-like [Perognathus longimembris pacificus]|uniref:collagen alpha-1(I) chain-like n=1 Tax=Perognathus longimembris pacificus TaxID=214514 RepID=UPI0020185F89|nr:collagen alpha-1(I) chain-like [Perognathus longimembris pacificus]
MHLRLPPPPGSPDRPGERAPWLPPRQDERARWCFPRGPRSHRLRPGIRLPESESSGRGRVSGPVAGGCRRGGLARVPGVARPPPGPPPVPGGSEIISASRRWSSSSQGSRGRPTQTGYRGVGLSPTRGCPVPPPTPALPPRFAFLLPGENPGAEPDGDSERRGCGPADTRDPGHRRGRLCRTQGRSRPGSHGPRRGPEPPGAPRALAPAKKGDGTQWDPPVTSGGFRGPLRADPFLAEGSLSARLIVTYCRHYCRYHALIFHPLYQLLASNDAHIYNSRAGAKPRGRSRRGGPLHRRGQSSAPRHPVLRAEASWDVRSAEAGNAAFPCAALPEASTRSLAQRRDGAPTHRGEGAREARESMAAGEGGPSGHLVTTARAPSSSTAAPQRRRLRSAQSGQRSGTTGHGPRRLHFRARQHLPRPALKSIREAPGGPAEKTQGYASRQVARTPLPHRREPQKFYSSHNPTKVRGPPKTWGSNHSPGISEVYADLEPREARSGERTGACSPKLQLLSPRFPPGTLVSGLPEGLFTFRGHRCLDLPLKKRPRQPSFPTGSLKARGGAEMKSPQTLLSKPGATQAAGLPGWTKGRRLESREGSGRGGAQTPQGRKAGPAQTLRETPSSRGLHLKFTSFHSP